MSCQVGATFPLYPPFQMTMMSFLAFSLRELGAEVALALGLPWG